RRARIVGRLAAARTAAGREDKLMARFRVNSPWPGTQLADLRVVGPGLEFSVDPVDEPHGPRNSWVPLDKAARDWILAWNKDPDHAADQRKPHPFARGNLPPHLKDIDPTKPAAAGSPQQLAASRPDEKDSGF